MAVAVSWRRAAPLLPAQGSVAELLLPNIAFSKFKVSLEPCKLYSAEQRVSKS